MANPKKVVVITGGARGMGLSHAKTLVNEGYFVCVADIIDTSDAVKELLAIQPESASGHYLDVADDSSWNKLAAEIENEHGSLYGLVNNAGISFREGINNTSNEVWEKMIGINLTGVFYGMRSLSPLMQKNGGGSIVNISSIAGQLGYHGAAYGASKWGVRGLTKSAAMEYAPMGIRVNSVHPGLINTPMVAGAEDFIKTSLKSIPMARAGDTSEVSSVISFLLSDGSSYLTGSELTVDGGLVPSGLYWQINNATKSLSVGD